MDDLEFWDDEERQKYETGYRRKLQDLLAGEGNDPDDDDEVIEEVLSNHNIRRCKTPEVDAELNFLKAKSRVVKRNQLDAPSSDYVAYIARSRGISKAEAKKWAKKALRGAR